VVNGPAVDKIDDKTGLRKGIEDSFKTVEAMATAQNLDGVEQLQSIDCPITKVILFSIIGTVLTKTVKYDPTSSVIRNPPELFGESEKRNQQRFEKKCQKLISALTSIHSSQSSKIGKVGSLGWNKLVNGLVLYLDKNGVSGKTIQRFSDMGICPSGRTLCDEIHQIANNLKMKEIRELPPSDKVRVTSNVFDNADIRLFGRCVNFVSVGNIHLFNEDKARHHTMNKEYIKGLPHPQKIHGEFIEPTEDDDRVAVNFIHNQNFYALQSTFIRMHINDESMINIRDTDAMKRTIFLLFAKSVWSHLICLVAVQESMDL
jgi:hypothetical protein